MTESRGIPPTGGPRMTLTVQRRFVTPEPDETLEALAARAEPA